MATTLNFGELFGYDPKDSSKRAVRARDNHRCPFRGDDALCNKGGKKSPLGTCALDGGSRGVAICPNRFLENGQIFQDAGRLVFGARSRVVAIPEISVLKDKGTRVGKVDFLVFRVADNGRIAEDFFAMEVQAVYISGPSVVPSLAAFRKTGTLPEPPVSRPDYRSSAQKRLIPQLSVKVPIFRRWGVKYFVVIDESFFEQLPDFQRQETLENSEITWLVYPLSRNKSGFGFELGTPNTVHTTEQAVHAALVEGIAPTRSEITEACQQRVDAALRKNVSLPTYVVD